MHVSAWVRSAVVVFLLISGVAQAQERRIALVIGNGTYVHVPQLTNPPEDARATAAALRRLGFDVQFTVNADRSTMERAIREFGNRAGSADVALFYYAGHAFQVSDRNLLIPTNAEIRDERDLRFETLDLEDVLGQISGRSGVNIIVVDACRDNPFSGRLKSATRGIKVSSGPAPVSASAGTLIAFATAPGTVAEDGQGGNSPFTTALLEHIETPGLEVRQLMARVRQSVRKATQGRQIPWESSSLETDFYFRGPPTEQPKPDRLTGVAGPNREAEMIFWNSVNGSDDPREYRAYLERFPGGVFASLARTRIEQLASTAPSAGQTGAPGLAQEPAATAPRQIAAFRSASGGDQSAAAIEPRNVAGVWHGTGSDGAQVLVAFYPTSAFEQRQVYPNGFVLTVTGRWSLKGRVAVLEPRQANPRVICTAPNDCRPVPLEVQEVPIDLRDGGSVLATPYAVMARAPQ